MIRVLNYNHTHCIPPGSVYVGRAMPQFSLAASKWANPFKVGRNGNRDDVIAKFELYLYASGLIREIHNLRGLNLVCWCAPQPCHGDVLLRLANATGPRPCSRYGQDDLRVDRIAAQLEEVEQQELTDSYLSEIELRNRDK